MKGIVASPTMLRSLKVGRSPVTLEHVAALLAMPALTFLNIGLTGLHVRDLVRFDRLSKVRELQLEFLAIDGDDLAVLRDCPRFETLSLSKSTGIEVASSTALGVSSLRSLDLTGAGLSGEGLRRLREALPDCHVSTQSVR